MSHKMVMNVDARTFNAIKSNLKRMGIADPPDALEKTFDYNLIFSTNQFSWDQTAQSFFSSKKMLEQTRVMAFFQMKSEKTGKIAFFKISECLPNGVRYKSPEGLTAFVAN